MRFIAHARTYKRSWYFSPVMPWICRRASSHAIVHAATHGTNRPLCASHHQPLSAAVQDLRRHGHQHRRPPRRPQIVSVGLRDVLSCVATRFPALQRAALRSFVFTRRYATVRATTSMIHEYRRVDGSEGLDVSNSWCECALCARVCLRTHARARHTHTLVRGYSACGVKRVWAVEACGGSRQSAAALCATDLVFHRCSLQVAGLLAAERDHGQATGRRPRISEGAIHSPDEMAARADGWAGTLEYGSGLCVGSAHDVVYFVRWMGEAKPW